MKINEGQPTATVTRLDEIGGFGVLESADGREIYFHKNSVLNDAFSSLAPGVRVVFPRRSATRDRRQAP